jgi:hypothetical protein
MHLLFLDESGTIDKSQTRFILGGIVVSEHIWHSLYSDILKIKNDYGINNSELKWRNFYPKSKDNAMKHLTPEQKNNLRDDIFAAITKYKSIKTFGVQLYLDNIWAQTPDLTHDEIYLSAYNAIVKRFQVMLSNVSNVYGINVNGIIICDHMDKRHNSNIKIHHEKEIMANNSTYPNIIECLFLVDSHLSLGVQLADMVIGAYYRKITKGDETHFNKIKAIFEKDSFWEKNGGN